MLVSMTIIILTFTYKELMVNSLNFFKCINVGDGYINEYRSVPDLSIDCKS